MRRKCCVPACDSADKCGVCQVSLSYFKAPRESSMIKKWEFALGIKNETGLLPRDRVCSLHFKKSDIITKRFVSMKRPSTNSKMILEISKLERDTVPSIFHREIKQCHNQFHNGGGSQGRCKKEHSRPYSETSVPSASPPGSSQSDNTSDDDSNDDEIIKCDNQVMEQGHKLLPSRRDYRLVAESVAHRSRRRQLRAYNILRIKWLEKRKNLEREIRLLEDQIHQIHFMSG